MCICLLKGAVQGRWEVEECFCVRPCFLFVTVFGFVCAVCVLEEKRGEEGCLMCMQGCAVCIEEKESAAVCAGGSTLTLSASAASMTLKCRSNVLQLLKLIVKHRTNLFRNFRAD